MSMIESAGTLLSLSRNVCRFRLLPCFLLIPFSVTPVASADAAYDLPDLVCPSGARLAKGKHFPSVEAARAALRAPPEQGAGLGVIANPNALDDQGAKAAMLQSKVFSAAGRHPQQDHRNFQSLLDTKLARLSNTLARPFPPTINLEHASIRIKSTVESLANCLQVHKSINDRLHAQRRFAHQPPYAAHSRYAPCGVCQCCVCFSQHLKSCANQSVNQYQLPNLLVKQR